MKKLIIISLAFFLTGCLHNPGQHEFNTIELDTLLNTKKENTNHLNNASSWKVDKPETFTLDFIPPQEIDSFDLFLESHNDIFLNKNDNQFIKGSGDGDWYFLDSLSTYYKIGIIKTKGKYIDIFRVNSEHYGGIGVSYHHEFILIKEDEKYYYSIPKTLEWLIPREKEKRKIPADMYFALSSEILSEKPEMTDFFTTELLTKQGKTN